jgi:aminoglycoside phosphotransferase (APT) family kinase protein
MADETTLDSAALRRYLERELGGDGGTLEVSAVESGRSNETVVVTWGDRRYVLRKPPAGASSESAHDVLREYRIMDALQDGPVPTPTTVLACDDDSILGSEFYLMAHLEGHVVRGEEPDAFGTPAARERFGKELVDTLAAIHSVDVEAVGLADLGRPEGFTRRQVDRWGKQLSWALERTERGDELAALDDVGDWLANNVPADPPAGLVHGDFKIDNVLFGPAAPPEIRGVLDWEMGTYGDPLTDLGWLLIHWHDAGDPDPFLPTVTPPFLERDGYVSRADLVDRYERESGLEFTDGRFYRALAAYKEAAACEVFYARYLRGEEHPFFERAEETVPKAAARAKRIVDGADSR